MTKGHEIEIKLALEDAGSVRRRLRREGFRLHHRRVREQNTIYDQKGRLRRSGQLLRIRQVGRRWVVTLKGKATPGRHKSRPELEFEATDGETVARVLSGLGFEPVFRYEKFRTEYIDGGGAAMVDETPIGDFLELEGEPEWIDAAACRLGFCDDDYITASYGALYQRFRREHPDFPPDMVFAQSPGR
jgi:adenylate cyclase class 2